MHPTLHPTPHTLHPMPYPTPYALCPAPCPLHPAPCTLPHTPYYLIPINNIHPTRCDQQHSLLEQCTRRVELLQSTVSTFASLKSVKAASAPGGAAGGGGSEEQGEGVERGLLHDLEDGEGGRRRGAVAPVGAVSAGAADKLRTGQAGGGGGGEEEGHAQGEGGGRTGVDAVVHEKLDGILNLMATFTVSLNEVKRQQAQLADQQRDLQNQVTSLRLPAAGWPRRQSGSPFSSSFDLTRAPISFREAHQTVKEDDGRKGDDGSVHCTPHASREHRSEALNSLEHRNEMLAPPSSALGQGRGAGRGEARLFPLLEGPLDRTSSDGLNFLSSLLQGQEVGGSFRQTQPRGSEPTVHTEARHHGAGGEQGLGGVYDAGAADSIRSDVVFLHGNPANDELVAAPSTPR